MALRFGLVTRWRVGDKTGAASNADNDIVIARPRRRLGHSLDWQRRTGGGNRRGNAAGKSTSGESVVKVEVRVFGDRMELLAGGRLHSAMPATAYRGRRLLIGSFEPAVTCLRVGLVEIGAVRRLKPRPKLVMQAMEMNDGGLSEVEERVLLEVGTAAGGRPVSVC